MAITSEHITGTGPWFGIQQQLQYDDVAIVQTRLCCLRAQDRVESPGQTTKSFIKVTQSLNEPYVEFFGQIKRCNP